jgi:hypothetical protein
MTVKSVNQTWPSLLRQELQAYYAPPYRSSLALVSFDYLRFDLCQYTTELERCAYVPESQIAPHLVDKDRLNAGIACEFETLSLVFLCAPAYEPTSKFLVVEIRCERRNVPLYTSHTKAGDNPRDSNRRWERCHGKLY